MVLAVRSHCEICSADGTGSATDDHSRVDTFLRAWASMLVFLSRDCIKRTQLTENRTSDCSIFLGKILDFCLEEIVALTRSIHEKINFGQEKDCYTLLFTVLSHCTEYVREILYETSTQVTKC